MGQGLALLPSLSQFRLLNPTSWGQFPNKLLTLKSRPHNWLLGNPSQVTQRATAAPTLLLRQPPLGPDLNRTQILPYLSWLSSYNPLWSSLHIGLSGATSVFPTGFYLFWNPQGVWSGSHFLIPQETPRCLNKCTGRSMGAQARAGLEHPGPTTPAQQQKGDA